MWEGGRDDGGRREARGQKGDGRGEAGLLGGVKWECSSESWKEGRRGQEAKGAGVMVPSSP